MDRGPKRRKRPRDDTDGQAASAPLGPSATRSFSDPQRHLPAIATDASGAGAECGRVSATRKTRRTAQAPDERPSHEAVTSTALSPVSRRVTSDAEAARTPSQAASTGASGYTSPVCALTRALRRPAAAVAAHDRVATNAALGVSPMRRVEKQLQFDGQLPKVHVALC